MSAQTSILSDILAAYPASLINGLLVNGVFGSFLFLVFWRLLSRSLQKRKIQLGKDIKPSQLKRELKNALLTMSLSALFACIILYFIEQGLATVYLDLTAYPLWWTLASFPLLLILNDTWFYWMHRLLHHKRIYRFVHHEHHKSLTVNPFTSFSFNPIEPLLLTVWILPVSLLVPLYAPVLAFVQIYGLLDNLKSHLGYELYPSGFNKSPLKFLTTSTYHDLHHTKFSGNYALHFRFWDWAMGTEVDTYEAEFRSARLEPSTATNLKSAE